MWERCRSSQQQDSKWAFFWKCQTATCIPRATAGADVTLALISHRRKTLICGLCWCSELIITHEEVILCSSAPSFHLPTLRNSRESVLNVSTEQHQSLPGDFFWKTTHQLRKINFQKGVSVLHVSFQEHTVSGRQPPTGAPGHFPERPWGSCSNELRRNF